MALARHLSIGRGLVALSRRRYRKSNESPREAASRAPAPIYRRLPSRARSDNSLKQRYDFGRIAHKSMIEADHRIPRYVAGGRTRGIRRHGSVAGSGRRVHVHDSIARAVMIDVNLVL